MPLDVCKLSLMSCLIVIKLDQPIPKMLFFMLMTFGYARLIDSLTSSTFLPLFLIAFT